MKKYGLFCLLTFLVACSPSAENERDETLALRNSIEAFNQAFATGNLAVLDSLTTERYIHTNSSDLAFRKDNWFGYLQNRTADIKEGNLLIDEYRLEEMNIEFYKESAIVTGQIYTSGTRNGEQFENKIRVSNFWVKEGEVWKRAGFHDSRIN